MNREEHSEPNVTQTVPLLAVSNMETAVHFYVNGLGFDMKNQWVDEGKLRWCWLQLGRAAVMLQEFKKAGHDAWVPKGTVGEGVSINFICNDALLIYRELISKNIPTKKPFVGNGMWVVGLSDPDGYNLFFESSTDMPEDSEYSEH